jgi:hypothetical protein
MALTLPQAQQAGDIYSGVTILQGLINQLEAAAAAGLTINSVSVSFSDGSVLTGNQPIAPAQGAPLVTAFIGVLTAQMSALSAPLASM